ncbi:hypothetical protein KV580_23565 [Pseudomonas chlororaphis]|nr:hypothetical protein [Pseudomonas chlororaphis]
MSLAKKTSYETLFDELAKFHKNITSEIHVLKDGEISAGSQELLTAYNIDHDELLKFQDDSVNNIKSGGYSVEASGGFSTHYLLDGKPLTAIFLHPNVLNIDKEQHFEMYWLILYICLHHELMHAKDLKLGKNFDIANRMVKLISAEAYADTKTLQYLDKGKSKNPLLLMARNTYAKSVIGNQKKGVIYERIYAEIVKTYPDRILQTWASESLL